MPAADGKGRGKGKLEGGGPGVAAQAVGDSDGGAVVQKQEAESDPADASNLEKKAEELKRKLSGSGLRKTQKLEANVDGLEDVVFVGEVSSQPPAPPPQPKPLYAPPKASEQAADTRSQTAATAPAPPKSVATPDQKMAARQERFGKDTDGTLAKSSVAARRSSSFGSASTSMPVSASAVTSADSNDANISSTMAAGSPMASKSSDGARNKAGSMQLPPRPRGTVGAASTTSTLTASSPTAAAVSSTASVCQHREFSASMQDTPADKARQTTASIACGREVRAEQQQVPKHIIPERSVTKAGPIAAVESLRRATGLKRIFEHYVEPARKRPRLAAGESAAWDSEYKLLLDWIDKHLPERIHSKARAQTVECTDEQLAALERAWQQLQ